MDLWGPCARASHDVDGTSSFRDRDGLDLNDIILSIHGVRPIPWSDW